MSVEHVTLAGVVTTATSVGKPAPAQKSWPKAAFALVTAQASQDTLTSQIISVTLDRYEMSMSIPLRRALLASPGVRAISLSPRLFLPSQALLYSTQSVVQPSFWKSLIPKPLRKSSSPSKTAKKPKSKEWNPATFFIWIFLFIGSMSIQMIALRREFANFSRRADARIGLLKEVIEKIQNGEEVDVEGLLGTGAKEKEQEWEEGDRLPAFRQQEAYELAQCYKRLSGKMKNGKTRNEESQSMVKIYQTKRRLGRHKYLHKILRRSWTENRYPRQTHLQGFISLLVLSYICISTTWSLVYDRNLLYIPIHLHAAYLARSRSSSAVNLTVSIV